MKLEKALFYNSKKRILLLFTMLVFVMFALFLNLTFFFSKYRIQDTLQKRNLPETIFRYDKYHETDELFLKYWDLESLNIKALIEDLGYTYTSVPTFQDEKLRLEAHAGDDYKVLEGKALDDLEGFEVAISKEYAQTLGTNILGGTLEFLDFEFTVESIIEYPNYEMAYQPLETLSQVDLFEEGILGAGITTDTATKALQEDLVRQYFDEYGEDFGLEIPEYHLLKVKFDTFTYDKERELLNSIASVNVWSRTFDNMFEIDSLTILTKSNPLIEMLKSTISKFVVSMIILSSTYAFYIHLKNELHSKRKTLGTLNLIGVSFKHVVQTYTLFFIKLFVSAYLTTTFITTVLGSFKPNFKPDYRILSTLFGLSFLFMTLIFGIFIYNLLKIRKNGFESMKSGGLSFFKTKSFKQERIIFNLAFKRFTKTITLSLGFVFSVGLSISVVLISLSALNSVSGVYHRETFGLDFDYYLVDPDYEMYQLLKSKDVDVSQVKKNKHIIFLDYRINQPIDNITTGSTVTIYDHIEPFVSLDKGDMPTPAIGYYGEKFPEVYDQIEVLASKRLMDVNQLRVSSDPSGPIDSHYLFIKQKLNDYEEGLPVRGSFTTLIDRGYVSYFHRKLYETGQMIGRDKVYPMIVKLKDAKSYKTYETLFEDSGVSFVHIDQILEEYTKSNEKINQDSLDILAIIVIAMSIQTFFNLSGVLVQVNENKRSEESFYHKIGIKNKVLKKVHHSELLVRFIASTMVSLLLSLIMLPILNYNIKEAFAITYLPTSLLKLISIILLSLSFIMIILLFLTSKYQTNKKNCPYDSLI